MWQLTSFSEGKRMKCMGLNFFGLPVFFKRQQCCSHQPSSGHFHMRSLRYGCAANAFSSSPVVAYNIKKAYIWCWDSEIKKWLQGSRVKQTPLWFCLFDCLITVSVLAEMTPISVKTARKEGVTRWQMMLPCQYYWESGVGSLLRLKKKVSCFVPRKASASNYFFK